MSFDGRHEQVVKSRPLVVTVNDKELSLSKFDSKLSAELFHRRGLVFFLNLVFGLGSHQYTALLRFNLERKEMRIALRGLFFDIFRRGVSRLFLPLFFGELQEGTILCNQCSAGVFTDKRLD